MRKEIKKSIHLSKDIMKNWFIIELKIYRYRDIDIETLSLESRRADTEKADLNFWEFAEDPTPA